MRRTDLIVELSDRKIFVARHGISPAGSAALIDCHRKVFGDVYGSRAYCRRRQAGVHERRSEKEGASFTEPGSVSRKITGNHIRSWNGRDCAQWALPGNRALIACKEKQFVLLNGATNGSAILVALQLIPYRSEEISSVHRVIAHKLKKRSVKIIGSGFCDRVHRASGMKPILRRQRTRLDLEFLQRIRERERQTIIGVHIVVHPAVERVCSPAKQSSGDAEARRVRVHTAVSSIGRLHRESRTGE